MIRRVVAAVAVAISAFAGWGMIAQPAAAEPITRLIGMALIDDVAYLMYQNPNGTIVLIPID